ncbi:MAG TPA: hypothetical protein VGM07_19990 [Stellaceae bacterium]|jgi:hypothetical protein
MAKANLDDRAALERIYPAEAYAADAAQNDLPSSTILKGVRVLSAPDAAGEFELEPGSRQVGEAAAAPFLEPHRREGVQPGADRRAGYEQFLQGIIEAARRFGFEADHTPGHGDPRIRGLRQ